MKTSHSEYFFKLILIILMLSSEVAFIRAQEFNIENFTVKAGLSHNNIRAITRDSTGFLWLATWDGLSRFDGYNFRNYFHIPNDSSSLSYFSVRNIVVDRFNNLWILNDQHSLQLYDRINDNFITLSEYAGIKLDNLQCIKVDSTGNLMFLNNNHVICWKKKEAEATICSLESDDGKNFRSNSAFFSDLLIRGNEIWLTGSDGSFMFSKEANNKFILYKTYRIVDPIKTRIDFDLPTWLDLYISATGNKWIFSNVGLLRCDEESRTFKVINKNIPFSEFQGKDSFFWGDLSDGIFVYETQSSLLKHIPVYETGIPSAIFPDKDKTLWYSGISHSGVPQGLSMVVFNSGFFSNYLMSAPDSTQPAVYSLTIDDKKNIWVGIRGYDEIVTLSANGIESTTGKLSRDAIQTAGHIRTMGLTEDGIWIGYFYKLLRYYSFSDRKFREYLPGPNHCRSILSLNGKVYIGNEDITSFDPATGETELVWKSNKNISTFKLCPEGDSIIWCAMAKGTIARVNIKTGYGTTIVIPPGQSNAEDIIRDRDGIIWIAFLGDGVCKYNPVTKEIKYFTTQNGLSNNTTYSLLEDRAGYLWVSTNDGISRINPVTGQIRKFGLFDGLKIHEFNSGAKLQPADGRFFFGGMGGFVSFYPDSLNNIDNSESDQKIIITEFEVSGLERILPKPINDIDTLILKPGEDDFHISFSTKNFRYAENTSYRYYLSGIDETWIGTGPDNRNLNYSNLKPGYHTLYIEANDINGNWSKPRKIIILIKPRYFQTMGFLIGMPALFVLLISVLILFYIRQIRFKEKQKQETLRLQALQGQMNPHFIFNSLNSINYFISNNDKLSANRYIADFARLIRSILHNMNHNYIRLEKEIESIEEYLKIEYLRFGDKFNYKLKIDDNIRTEELMVSPGLVQPFIENAIWHGIRSLEKRKGNILISFKLNENKLSCIIEDDGIGRNRSAEMKSKNDPKISRGISIIIERLRILSNLHNQNYKVSISDIYNNRTETGTRVMVDLPLEKV